MPAAPSSDFLQKKVGILPVWAWGLVGLLIAYAYSRYKNNQANAQGNGTTSTTNAAGESTASAPQFIIENNEPPGGNASATVNISGQPPVPVVTPPGTGPTPPVLQGGNPPRGPGGPVPAQPPGKAPAPTPTPTKPTSPHPQTYTVQRGDTLWGIAQHFYGNGEDYKQIWSYNQNSANRKGLPKVIGSNPGLIYPGEVFVIPPK